jgi:Rrf2 family protein
MLSLTRKADYALVAMADLARQSPSTVTARDMAGRLRMPLPALQHILTRLMHRGLVISIRGAQGGYRLNRRPDQITIAELIAVMDGPLRLTPCCATSLGERECHMEDVCPIREPVRKVHGIVRRCLDQITLDHLAWDRVPLRLSRA